MSQLSNHQPVNVIVVTVPLCWPLKAWGRTVGGGVAVQQEDGPTAILQSRPPERALSALNFKTTFEMDHPRQFEHQDTSYQCLGIDASSEKAKGWYLGCNREIGGHASPKETSGEFRKVYLPPPKGKK